MDALALFALQLTLSLVLWGLIAKGLFAPWLAQKSPHQALFWLTLPHAFRYMGMVFLVPGISAQPLPEEFAISAAYGDLSSALLALAALIALRAGWAGVLALVWVFNIVGTVDLLYALSHADVVPDLGAAWYIPTLFVPLLLVTHFMIFVRLIKKES